MNSQPHARITSRSSIESWVGSFSTVTVARVRRFTLHLTAHAGLSLIGLTCLFPFLWMLSTSFKLQGHVFIFPPQWIPNPATLENYQKLFTYIPFFRQFLNTVLVSGTIVIGQLFFCAAGAYAFARLRFPGRDTLFLVYLGTMMIPGQVTLIPSYILIKLLGWVNTYFALIVPPFFGSAFGTFLLRQFFLTIPTELEDAAHIDGAGYFRIFTTIMLPLVRPALATLAVFAFVYFWNDFLWPLVVINSEHMKTLTVAVATLSRSYFGTDWPTLMAGAVLSVLPLLAIFFTAQRQFVEGIVMSGLKG